MERTIISWNLPNWITISLMAFATWLVICLARQAMMKYTPAAQSQSAY